MIGKIISFNEKSSIYDKEREFVLQVEIKGERAVELLTNLYNEDVKEKGLVDICKPIMVNRDILPSNILETIRNSFRYKCSTPKNEVIFNEPATVLYKDGKKYVCKCDKEDKFSEELGLALCLLKAFGVSYSDFEKLLKGAKRQGVKNEKQKSIKNVRK